MPYSFICIHDKSAETRLLYLSSGVRQAMGYQPQAMVGHSAVNFIADDWYAQDYPEAYQEDDDETSVTVMNLNAKRNGGDPIATRLVAFNCETCILIVAIMFPEQPYTPLSTLGVRRLDHALEQQSQPPSRNEGPGAQVARPPRTQSVFVTRAPQPKACFVLERISSQQVHASEDESNSHLVTKPNGPQIVFVTNSINRILNLDGDELINTPFLRLLAPESLVKASQFLDELSRSDGIVFALLYFLRTPFSGSMDEDGDGGENGPTSGGSSHAPTSDRVEVELVGAQSDDGAVLLCRKVTVCPPAGPGRGLRGGRIPAGGDDDGGCDGYLSLSEILSSDPETSDCPSLWSNIM
ncbi:hypothetical protein GQ54DRAFT_257864 [Martensiomyces pterosporus]|nr:hypothetical protein GQ54DRAFT_257864 [Martensiomyces pterosporus]